MLEVAATRLTPEKLALLNYKLATGSPTAAKIVACIKPGEWESATGDTRQFNDIRLRLEDAIDAWIAGDPQSKGFVWPQQVIKLNLTDAAAKLSKLTTVSTSQVSIIRAGADNKIPVYWFNDLHRATYIADFTCSPPRDLRDTYSGGPQQLTHQSLRELSIADSIAVFDFQFTDKDFTLLEKIKSKAVGDDGNLLGYRHPATKDGTVTVTRDQLFVYGHDLKAYAATLMPDKVVDTQPAPWWQTEHNILDFAQSIGAKLHDQNEKSPKKDRFATSNRKISEVIASRIKSIESSKACPRDDCPNWETVRKVALKGWKFTPK